MWHLVACCAVAGDLCLIGPPAEQECCLPAKPVEGVPDVGGHVKRGDSVPQTSQCHCVPKCLGLRCSINKQGAQAPANRSACVPDASDGLDGADNQHELATAGTVAARDGSNLGQVAHFGALGLPQA